MKTPDVAAKVEETKRLPKAASLSQVADMDTKYQWPDKMTATARDRMAHFALSGVPDPSRSLYHSFIREAEQKMASSEPVKFADEAKPAAGETFAKDGQLSLSDPQFKEQLAQMLDSKSKSAELAQMLEANGMRVTPQGMPSRFSNAYATPRTPDRGEPPHPLAYNAEALDQLQKAIDTHTPARIVANRPDASFSQALFATVTTGTLGAPRAWGANVLRGPRMLSNVSGTPTQSIDAVFAQHPKLALPATAPAAAEGASLVEYASTTSESVTLGRFGRYTDLSRESLVGADAGAITSMHRASIALDLDKVLIDAANAAAGTPLVASTDAAGAIRSCIATVLANTAEDDPGAVVVVCHPSDAAKLQDVTPTGGNTMGERFQRFAGALVYPSNSATLGFMLVGNFRAGSRFFIGQGLSTLTHTDPRTGVETAATFIIAGYGVTLSGAWVVKQDVIV